MMATCVCGILLQVFSGSMRTRMEAWDWFPGDANSTYPFSGTIFRLSIAKSTKNFDWQVEAALPVLLGLPNDAVTAAPQGQLGLGASYFVANNRSRNAALPFIKQGFVRFKNLGGNEAHSLRVGRMEFVDGTEVAPKDPTLAAVKRDRIAHRLIGHFGWTHVGRSFDGANYVYNHGRNNVTLFGARPTRGVFQVDGWGELDIALGYGAFTRQVGKDKSSGELRLFGIFYDDWRNVLKTDTRALALRRADTASIRIGTVGAHYLHSVATPSGTVDILLWGVVQTGKWGRLDHRAAAVSAEAGYQPPIAPRLKPWFRGGFSYGSGDSDPNDNKHGTFFQMLPTPRWLSRFPFYNMMNNEDAFGEVILRPSKKLNIRSEIHSLRLASSNDFWYQGGGAFQPWTFGYTGRPSGGHQDFATLWDISADYQFNAHVSLGAYFGLASGGGVVRASYPGDQARFGYVELAYKF